MIFMTIPLRKTGLKRDSAFGYSCSRCLVCCRFKKIQLNPYEIARMAANKAVSTSEFIARFTTTGGTVLKAAPDGACIFLDTEGCSVHPDRPLVCRLYPLGRHVPLSGEETFSQMESEPECKGAFHENGTIEHYLKEQDAGPFLHAADLYLDLLWLLMEMLKEQESQFPRSESIFDKVGAVTDREAGGHDLSWIDMDRALADYCRERSLPVPENIEEKMALHIKAVREWAA